MKIEQIYTGCLAQGSYYIHSKGEGVVIDPLREVTPYLERAKADNVRIKYIFETHFHADFVSGHVTLAEKTGAQIVYGPGATPAFKAHTSTDGEIFKVGDITFKLLHTPGHTMESSVFLLSDEQGREHAVFTGDTLFLGDVGRPDLAQKGAELTQEDLASYLYDSLRKKIMPLPDSVIVYPAHGAGSACGKNMMKETYDTLGNQKKVNYALRSNMTREEFIREVTDGLTTPPAYFPLNVKMNKEGYKAIEDVLSGGMTPLTPQQLEDTAEHQGALVLDVRTQEEYAEAHIPRSLFIGLDGKFAPWVGELVADVTHPIVLVAPPGKEEEAVTRLSRVGFDRTLGYLKGGIEAWKKAGKETDNLTCIKPQDFAERYAQIKDRIFDVRRPGEYQSEHIVNAKSIPLAELHSRLSELPDGKDFYLYCGTAYRSTIASSVLKMRGIHNFVNVSGGFKAVKETPAPVTAYVCPSTLSA